MMDQKEPFEDMVEDMAEAVILNLLNMASEISEKADGIDGLAFLHMVGIKTLRNVLANSIGMADKDATEEKLREFHDSWIKECADFLKVSEDMKLMDMRDRIDAQQKG